MMYMEKFQTLGLIRAACIKSNPLRWGTLTKSHEIEAFEQHITFDDVSLAVSAAKGSPLTEKEMTDLLTLWGDGSVELENVSDENLLKIADMLKDYV